MSSAVSEVNGVKCFADGECVLDVARHHADTESDLLDLSNFYLPPFDESPRCQTT